MALPTLSYGGRGRRGRQPEVKDDLFEANLHTSQPSSSRRLQVETAAKLSLAVSREREFYFRFWPSKLLYFDRKPL